MRYNFKQEVLDYEGNPIPVRDGENLTWRKVAVDALNTPGMRPDGQQEVMTPEDKSKAFEISTKIFKTKEVKLTSDQVSMLKKRIGETWGSLVFGRACEFLEGETPALPLEKDEVVEAPVEPEQAKV